VERRAKERLVGAVVLMAAANIVIPPMLSGPHEQQSVQKPTPGETPLKTYTIDLNRPPGGENLTAVPPPETAVPPPAAGAPAPTPADVPQVNPEPLVSGPPSAATPTTAAPTEADRKQQEGAAVSRPQPRADPEPPVSSPPPAPPKALVPKPTTPTSRGWAVQLASFSRESAAQKMASDLKDRGYDAFVMAAKSGTSTRYRVRVGPVGDRSAAEANLRKLKAVVPEATLVSHP
jgi:DedD protein